VVRSAFKMNKEFSCEANASFTILVQDSHWFLEYW